MARPRAAVRRCPDDGACHHECAEGECFRVRACAPLGDREDWTAEEKAEFGGEPKKPVIEDVIVRG